MGAVSADMALDALKDAADAEILAVCNGLGRYVPLIASLCRSRSAGGSMQCSCARLDMLLVSEACEHTQL